MDIESKNLSYALMTVVVVGMVIAGIAKFIDSLDGKVAYSWLSPSHWLYVKYVNGTVNTAYGDFNFSEDGLQMFKKGSFLGSLRIGRSGFQNFTNATMLVDCNEPEKWCDLNITWEQDSLFLHFDQFRLKVSYQLENTGNTTLKDRIYLILDTPSKIKKDSENRTIFENRMSFNVEDVRKNQPGVIDYKSVSSKGLVFATKTITLDPGEKFLIDPDWTTPSAIQAECGLTNPDYMIDDDTGTDPSHLANEMHYFVFDMGDVYSVSGVRFFTNDEVPLEGVYVSEDTTFSEDERVIADETCIPDLNDGWANETFTAKDGRYINVSYYRTGSCSYSAWPHFGNDWFEFDAYIEAVTTTAPTTTTTTPAPPADTCTYSGSGDWNLICNDNCSLQNNNTVVNGTLIINTTTGSLVLINTNLTVYNISNEACPIWLDSTSRFWIGE